MDWLKSILREKEDEVSDSRLEAFLKSIFIPKWNEFMEKEKEEIEKRVNAKELAVPNATKGKEYEAVLLSDCEGIAILKLEGLEQTGLSVQKSDTELRIQGVPNKAGTFPLTLRYKISAGESSFRSRIFELRIDPNPRDLWKDRPVPSDTQYSKADTECVYVKSGTSELEDGTPRKNMVAASKRGRSHAHDGKPRDDHYVVQYSKESEWYIMAVADGAGSAKFSREGSRIACETVKAYCEDALMRSEELEKNIACYSEDIKDKVREKVVGDGIYDILVKAALEANRAIEVEAQKQSRGVREYATTLLLAICKRFDFGWFVATFWVGDGAICLYDANAPTAQLLGVPDEGEYAGQTRFLTSPDIFSQDSFDAASVYKRLRIKIVEDFTALFLMTDGVSDPMFGTAAHLEDPSKWDALWENLIRNEENPINLENQNETTAEQLLKWLDFWSEGNHDDRTIAILS